MLRRRVAVELVALLLTAGCAWRDKPPIPPPERDYYLHHATDLEYPDVKPEPFPSDGVGPPRALLTERPARYRDLRLQEAIHTALTNSTVLADLGGTVLRNPNTIRTIQGPAIAETDPRFGVDAALAAFDAQFVTRAFFEKNDRAFNNLFAGQGTVEFRQDAYVFQTAINKRAATGTQLSIRHNTDYDSNNAPANLFPSAWNTNIEGEFRQPLMQGATVAFNRIAGPDSFPGFYNGVLVARINTDVSLADFEAGVLTLVSEVENAYWDLYFAYRDLDAKLSARDIALETWRRVQALQLEGRVDAEQEAYAREQFYRFQEEVQNALTGRLVESTRSYSGSSGGTFRATTGVYTAERRLRLLMMVPINGDELFRPADEPSMARMIFDWDEVLQEALARRVELRRQKWLIKRRELELAASRNFLLPRFDAVGRYRWRGFGQDLIDLPRDHTDPFASAWQNLTSGKFQEWQLGAELTFPFGYRRAHAGVRNAELLLMRERAVLAQQEQQIIFDLSNAFAELDRAYGVAQTAFNRRLAARQQLAELQAKLDRLPLDLDLELEAQRRVADSDTRFYLALSDYALALKNIHFEKGSLLDFNEVFLAEGPWPGKAYRDAEMRDSFRAPPGPLNYILKHPRPISAGHVPQQIHTPGLPLEGGLPASGAPPGAPPEAIPPPSREELPPAEDAPLGRRAEAPTAAARLVQPLPPAVPGPVLADAGRTTPGR
jgi:outer membrane protein TolC